jgi:hypothetical protein
MWAVLRSQRSVRALRCRRVSMDAEDGTLIKRLVAVMVVGWCSTFCAAQQNADDLPANYKTMLTDRFVKVIRVHYGPLEKVPVHNHPEVPTVYVYLNDSGPVRLTHFEDGKQAAVVVRPPTHKGAYRVSVGRRERHSIENLSELPSDYLRVELPGFRMADNLEFRGKVPADLSHDMSIKEFEIPRLTITRTVCVEATPCEVKRPATQAVVVAFSDVTLSAGSGASPKRTEMKLGDVLVVSAQEALSLSAAGHEPAHVLTISVGDASSTGQ